MKGKKTCSKCKAIVGCRTQQCPKCKHLFSTQIKESVRKDGSIIYKTKNVKKKKIIRSANLREQYQEVTPLEEDLQKYPNVRIWIHKTYPNYCIKYTPIVCGVLLDSDKSYGAYLVLHNDLVLDIGTNNGRFHSFLNCLKSLYKYIKNHEITIRNNDTKV